LQHATAGVTALSKGARLVKYTVSVWNSEVVEASSKKEAVEIVKQQLKDRDITRRDFEFDDVEIVTT
jgi:methionyl-tRNA synthetase